MFNDSELQLINMLVNVAFKNGEIKDSDTALAVLTIQGKIRESQTKKPDKKEE